MGEVDDYAAAHAAELRSVLQGLKGELRGQPLDVAEQRLVSALRDRDMFLSTSSVRMLAQQLADPWWSVKHPLRARRRLRDWAQQEEPKSKAAQTEADEVLERVDRVLSAHGGSLAWSLTARATFDGTRYELELRPHSAAVADRVRRELHPIPIRILDQDPPN